MEIYSVNLRIQSNTGKYGPEKTPYLDSFHVMNLKNKKYESFELSRLAMLEKGNGICTSSLIIFDNEIYVTLVVSWFYLSCFKEVSHFALEVQRLIEAVV